MSGSTSKPEAGVAPVPAAAGGRGRFAAAIEAIDAANAKDPTQEIWQGQNYPAALLYGQRMSERLVQFAPDAPEALRLAARAQHIERWRIPRDTYPAGRQGYHRWRRDLADYHAERTGAILQALDYPIDMIERVQALLRKKNLKSDVDAQCLEDVICLVFLQYYLADFAGHQDADKLTGILRKTWVKMSPRGQESALALPLQDSVRQLVAVALQSGLQSGT